MNENGLNDAMNLIKRKKWDRLFKRRELMHIDACKEFYANLTMFHYKKHEVVRPRVRGVEFEFDNLRLASILGVLGKTGICEYNKDVWEDSKYINTLETTGRFANGNMITTTRRVRLVEMKSFQRFVHFVVMKNIVLRFGKRDTTSYMDLTYMDHLISRRLVNLPRVIMRHMSYVISVKDHELSYGDWMTMVFEAFDVPLIDKQGEEPKSCASGEHMEKEVGDDESGSGEKFFDAEDEVEESIEVSEGVQDVPAPARVRRRRRHRHGSTLGPIGSILESVMIKLQAEFEGARASEFERFGESSS
ncbi:hypothetical protein Dimus_032148 [Dionaea muscipula]